MGVAALTRVGGAFIYVIVLSLGQIAQKVVISNETVFFLNTKWHHFLRKICFEIEREDFFQKFFFGEMAVEKYKKRRNFQLIFKSFEKSIAEYRY